MLNDYREKTGALYVYTLGEENNKWYLYIDGQPKEVDQATGVVTKEELPKEASLPKLADGTKIEPIVTSIVEDPKYGKYVSGFVPIRNSEGRAIGMLGVDIGAAEVDSISHHIITKSLPITVGYGLAFAVLVIVLCSLIIRKMVLPLKILSGAARRIANVDLTVEKIEVKSNDEIRELANSFNGMVANLHTIIHKGKDSSVQVAALAEELSASADQSSKATDQIAQSIQQISMVSETQRERVAQTFDWILHLSSSSESIAQKSAEMNELAQKAVELTVQGLQAVNTIVAQMREMSDTVQNTANGLPSPKSTKK